MALTQSPKIVIDGLVFAYDMANSQKSWKGAPTTNLCDNNVFYSNWTNSGAGVWDADDQDIPRLYQDLPLLSLRVTTAGNLHISHARASISAGLTYTVSTHIYIPSSAGTLAGAVPYIRTDPANTNRGNLAYNGSTDWNTWPRDEWIRISQTFTNSANDTALYISCYLDSLNNEVYFTGPQVENLSVMSGFTGGAGLSRSNTQAVVDLTGNNTWTVNNLTYASDGTFSFNGSNSWIESPTSSVFDTQSLTMESWNKPTTTSQNGFLFEKGLVNTQYSNFYNTTYFYFRTIGLSTQDLTFTASTYITANQWNHIVCTYASGVKTVYINGVQRYQQTGLTGTIPTGQTNQYVGKYGAGSNNYPFNGSIGVSRVYNRALTADEVKQNFNALRGRYGL